MADDLKLSVKDDQVSTSISLRKMQEYASGRVCDKLARLDKDGDGFIDEKELVVAVEELVNEIQTKQYLKIAAIFAAVLFLLLSASMAGLTYGVVYLTKDTRIAPGNFMVVKGPDSTTKPVLNGGAVMDLGLTTFNGSDSGLIVVALEGRRRRLLATGDASSLPAAPNPDLTYHSSVPLAMLKDLCMFHSNGLSTFTGTLPNRDAQQTEVQQVHIHVITGCDKTSSDLGSFYAELEIDSVRVEVHCTDTTCAAYYDQGSLRLSNQVQEPQAEVMTDVLDTMDATLVTSDGIVVGANNFSVIVEGGNGTRKLQAWTESGCWSAGYQSCNKCSGWGTILLMTGAKIGSNFVPGVGALASYGVDAFIRMFPGCCWACDPGWTVNGNCGCKKLCFPASATVTVAGKGAVNMEALQYGDRVLSIDRATGTKVFKEVYLFGHRDNITESPYVNIHTTSNLTLQLSPTHYVPVCTASCTAADLAAGAMVIENKYAADVRKGDVVLVSPAGADRQLAEPSAVADVWVTRARGAFNPYVRGADLIVNNVAASSHSEWLLDAVTPSSLRKHLPAIYEAMLAPVYMLYNIIGPSWAEWLAHGVGLAEAGASNFFGAGYLAVTGTMAAVLAVPAMLVRTSLK